MRILQVTHQYPPHHVGGVELITQALSNHLTHFGHTVAVLTRAPVQTQQTFDERGVIVHRLPEAASKAARFVATFADISTLNIATQVIKQFKPAVVHIQQLMGFPSALVSVFDEHHIPYVISLHDYWFVCANAQRITNDTHQVCDGPHGDNCGRCMLARTGLPTFASSLVMPIATRRNRALQQVIGHARAVIANSQFVLDWFGTQGFDTRAWSLARYGLDRPNAFARSHASHPFRVAYVGGLAWQKGVHVLIDAFNALPHDAELCIAGDETAFPDYVAQLKTVATHPGIRFVGRQTRDDVWRLLGESDVVAVPALWHETSSLIAQEGLAAGCYVLAARMGAIGEAITDNTHGRLIAPGDVAAWRDALMDAHTKQGVHGALPQVRTTEAYASDIEAIYKVVA